MASASQFLLALKQRVTAQSTVPRNNQNLGSYYGSWR
jgi:hypothetical protein